MHACHLSPAVCEPHVLARARAFHLFLGRKWCAMYAFQEQFLCTRREEQTPRALDDHSIGNCRRPDEAIPGFQARGTRSRTIEMSHNTGNSTDVPAGVGSGKGKPPQHVSTMGNPSHWDSLRLRIGEHRARSEFCFSSYCSTRLCLGCGSRPALSRCLPTPRPRYVRAPKK